MRIRKEYKPNHYYKKNNDSIIINADEDVISDIDRYINKHFIVCPICGKLTKVKRLGKKFCSDSCRVISRNRRKV